MIHTPPPAALTPTPTRACILPCLALLAIGWGHATAGAATPAANDIASTTTAAASSSAAKSLCKSQAPGYDSLLIQCPIAASATPQRLRFKVNFSGGHDDTMASITPSLDDVPLACDKGSKLSLMGEDGDVSLDCRFSMAEKPGTKKVLRVKVSWSHAQYVDFEFKPD